MSFSEKTTWVYLFQSVMVGAIYFAIVLPQTSDTPVDEIGYVGLMVGAIVLTIIISIIGAILAAVSNPAEADKRDERDKEIERFGDLVGGNTLTFLMVAVLILVWVETEHFWIANAIFAAFIVQAIVGSIVKLLRYRRGF